MRYDYQDADRIPPQRRAWLQGTDVLPAVQPALPYFGRAMVGAREGEGRVIRALFAGLALTGPALVFEVARPLSGGGKLGSACAVIAFVLVAALLVMAAGYPSGCPGSLLREG